MIMNKYTAAYVLYGVLSDMEASSRVWYNADNLTGEQKYFGHHYFA